MLPGGIKGAKAKAAESDNCFASDSLKLDINLGEYNIKSKSQALQFGFNQEYLRVQYQALVVQSPNDTFNNMTHRGGVFISLEREIGYNAAREVKRNSFYITWSSRAVTSTKKLFAHRNLRLHGHCDEGLHQGVQRCIQAEEIERR